MIDYFHHVTVTTGHVSESYQVDIDAEALDVCRELLIRALGGEPAMIDLDSEVIGVAASQLEQSVLLEILSRSQGACNDVLVATCVISPGDIGGHALWAKLHQGAGFPVATNGLQPPDGAWCAVRLEPAGDALNGAVRWLGDFERGMAWAWFHLQGGAPSRPPTLN